MTIGGLVRYVLIFALLMPTLAQAKNKRVKSKPPPSMACVFIDGKELCATDIRYDRIDRRFWLRLTNHTNQSLQGCSVKLALYETNGPSADLMGVDVAFSQMMIQPGETQVLQAPNLIEYWEYADDVEISCIGLAPQREKLLYPVFTDWYTEHRLKGRFGY